MQGFDESLADRFKGVMKTVRSMAGEVNKGFMSEITDFALTSSVSKDLSLETISNADFAFEDESAEVVGVLNDVKGLLEKIYHKDTNTYLDGEKKAKNSYDKQMKYIRRERI